MGSQRVRHDWVTKLNWTDSIFGSPFNLSFDPLHDLGFLSSCQPLLRQQPSNIWGFPHFPMVSKAENSRWILLYPIQLLERSGNPPNDWDHFIPNVSWGTFLLNSLLLSAHYAFPGISISPGLSPQNELSMISSQNELFKTFLLGRAIRVYSMWANRKTLPCFQCFGFTAIEIMSAGLWCFWLRDLDKQKQNGRTVSHSEILTECLLHVSL